MLAPAAGVPPVVASAATLAAAVAVLGDGTGPVAVDTDHQLITQVVRQRPLSHRPVQEHHRVHKPVGPDRFVDAVVFLDRTVTEWSLAYDLRDQLMVSVDGYRAGTVTEYGYGSGQGRR